MRQSVWLSVGLAALALAGCSKSEPSGSRTDATTSDSAGQAAPGVDVTAAPGVAFNYRYTFRLPATRLSAVQEQHAQACEKLGLAHCRIIGMHYRVLGENSVEGALQFKLDPALARAFGKHGADAIIAAQGKLIAAEITGTDAASEIAKQQGLRAQADAERARIDRELARGDLKSQERAELQQQRASLVGQSNDAKAAAGQQAESLANTPVEFDYESGPAIQGFDGSAPITSAANVFVDSATITIGFALTLLAAATPPGIIIVIAWLLWRRFRPRRPSDRYASDPT